MKDYPSFNMLTILFFFMKHDLEKAQNLKLILSAFEQLSGLKINFHRQGYFPMRYLGIPIHYRRLTIAEWKLVEERLQKCLSSWKCKLLSLEERLLLINLVLSNMVLHMISFFLLPKGVLHKLDYYRSRFLWQGDSEKRKYRLAKWSVVCSPKDQGGLGIHDLEVKNTGSGFLSYWRRRGLGKPFLRGNTLVRKRYLRFFGNRVIHIFGLDLWQRRSFSLV
jgi:hypothetical protein